MIKVYVDTGGWMPALTQLKESGLVTTVHFPYEQRLKKIDSLAKPSNLTWGGSVATWADLKGASWADTEKKPMHDAIANVIGGGLKKDVQHMASAHASGCVAFLTSDKGDIWRHREELVELLGIHVFHSASEWSSFVSFCEASRGQS